MPILFLWARGFFSFLSLLSQERMATQTRNISHETTASLASLSRMPTLESEANRCTAVVVTVNACEHRVPPPVWAGLLPDLRAYHW